MIKNYATIPGLSEHNAVFVDCGIRAQITKKPLTETYLFSHANWDKLNWKCYCSKIVGIKIDFSLKQSIQEIERTVYDVRTHEKKLVSPYNSQDGIR